ncbi:S41 family peptidase [Rhodanobacter sp. BL-MT-08]
MHLYRPIFVFMLLLSSMQLFAQAATPSAPIESADRKAVIKSLGEQLKANYVFPDIAEKVETTLSANAASGAYDGTKTTDVFAAALTKDLQSVSKDLHFRVDYDATFKPEPDDNKPATKEELDDARQFAEHMGFGIAKVERLPGNVGYLDIRGFLPTDFVTGAYGAAMNLLSGTDAMILDLRQNDGGDPSAVAALLSYFFAAGDSRHLNDLYWRSGNRTQEFWTMPVAGSRYAKPVYVLTSPDTFSGGEECAYDFQTQKRGILVGQTTGGGANPGAEFSVGHNFVVFIPTGRAINPITKTNWEHVGVKPDVAVHAADALKTAYATILKTLIPKTKDPDQLSELKSTLVRLEKGEDEKSDYAPQK